MREETLLNRLIRFIVALLPFTFSPIFTTIREMFISTHSRLLVDITKTELLGTIVIVPSRISQSFFNYKTIFRVLKFNTHMSLLRQMKN